VVDKQFIEKKIGLSIRLTMGSKFEERKEELASKNPGVPEPELKKILEQELMNEGLDDWVRDAASRVSIKILDPKFAEALK
jgi:hypothetical protein